MQTTGGDRSAQGQVTERVQGGVVAERQRSRADQIGARVKCAVAHGNQRAGQIDLLRDIQRGIGARLLGAVQIKIALRRRGEGGARGKRPIDLNIASRRQVCRAAEQTAAARQNQVARGLNRHGVRGGGCTIQGHIAGAVITLGNQRQVAAVL